MVDRTKTPPFLLRVYAQQGGFNKLDRLERQLTTPPSASALEIENGGSGAVADAAVQTLSIHTWRDASLGELTDMLAPEIAEVSLLNTDHDNGTRAAAAGCEIDRCRLAYRLVYGDTDTGTVMSRDLGVVSLRAPRTAYDARVTLESGKFAVGDLLDVAVLRPGDALYNFAPTKSGDRGYRVDRPQQPVSNGGSGERYADRQRYDQPRHDLQDRYDDRRAYHDHRRSPDSFRHRRDSPYRDRGRGGRMAWSRSRSPYLD